MYTNIDIINEKINNVLRNTGVRLKAANAERGNAWENIGLLGLFLEVRTMYLRLRNLVWDEFMNVRINEMTPEHKKRVADCLLDLRAYTVLTELAMQDNNFFGNDNDKSLAGRIPHARYEKV